MSVSRSSSAMHRRRFLHGTGVALALPVLDAFLPRGRAAAAAPRTNMVCLCAPLGIHAPFWFPSEAGSDYKPTPYLEIIKDYRADFTLFSGLSHPDQSGADGHSSGMTWLTSARNPGLQGFKNTVSIDQFAAETIGLKTRYPSLVLGNSHSYTRGGVLISGEGRPSRVFAKLFLDGSPAEVKEQLRKLREGQSILDAVQDDARSFTQRVGATDREKLDEYFSSVRELEKKLDKSKEWTAKAKPKPPVDTRPPTDVNDGNDVIGQMKVLLELIPLALQTDSTRLITVGLPASNSVPPIQGVTIDFHNCSHHGKDPVKIEQLRIIEEAEMRVFRDLLGKLKTTKNEDGTSLLDNTMVLFGSNLGNANAHDTRNLPILLAGGGFKHGRHVAFDAAKNTPLCNLFTSMLARLGLEVKEPFGSGTGTLTGLEVA